MAENHEMNYYNYGKTLSAEGVVPVLGKGENKHDYVDLGLPSGTLWATENIKNKNGEELYFAWGETSGYTAEQVGVDKYFIWGDYTDESGVTHFHDYKFFNGLEIGTNRPTFTKYNSTDGKTTLDAEDDAAIVNCGDDWRMPTKDDFDELLENTTSSWTEVNGVSGLLLTSTVEGYEEETLFFPAVGYAYDGQVNNIGENGKYWSDKRGGKGAISAYPLYFSSENCEVSPSNRCDGFSVRPVRVENI